MKHFSGNTDQEESFYRTNYFCCTYIFIDLDHLIDSAFHVVPFKDLPHFFLVFIDIKCAFKRLMMSHQQQRLKYFLTNEKWTKNAL